MEDALEEDSNTNVEIKKEPVFYKNRCLQTVNNKLFKNIKNDEVNKNIIFVYTPPKVASTSLVSSIRLCASYKWNIIHVHDETMLASLINIPLNDITIYDIIKYNEKIGRNVLVIDVFRSPIERKMSEFFEHLTFHFNNSYENIKKIPIEKIIERFNSLYPHIAKDDYFLDKYNIPLPEHFDFDNKYLFIEHDGIKYLKLRMMDISEWGKILSRFLDTDIYMVKDYDTRTKELGELYDTFKKKYTLPESYFHSLKNNVNLTFYLNEGERKKYLGYWIEKMDTNSMISRFTKEEYDFYFKLSCDNFFYRESIQTEHYMDQGCLCKYCIAKRRGIFERLKKGEIIKNEKVIHDTDLIKIEMLSDNIVKMQIYNRSMNHNNISNNTNINKNKINKSFKSIISISNL